MQQADDGKSNERRIKLIPRKKGNQQDQKHSDLYR